MSTPKHSGHNLSVHKEPKWTLSTKTPKYNLSLRTQTPHKSPAPPSESYSLALKREIVEETLKGVESVSVIARRYDVNANMVFRWRRLYEKGELGKNPPMRYSSQ